MYYLQVYRSESFAEDLRIIVWIKILKFTELQRVNLTRYFITLETVQILELLR